MVKCLNLLKQHLQGLKQQQQKNWEGGSKKKKDKTEKPLRHRYNRILYLSSGNSVSVCESTNTNTSLMLWWTLFSTTIFTIKYNRKLISGEFDRKPDGNSAWSDRIMFLNYAFTDGMAVYVLILLKIFSVCLSSWSMLVFSIHPFTWSLSYLDTGQMELSVVFWDGKINLIQ